MSRDTRRERERDRKRGHREAIDERGSEIVAKTHTASTITAVERLQ